MMRPVAFGHLSWTRLPILIGMLLVTQVSCTDDEVYDIVIDHLRIADLQSGAEIADPTSGQHVGLEMVFKTPGITEMVRYVFSIGDSVITDFREATLGSDRFARSGFEFVLPDAGSYLFRVIADPENLIVEDDETNNTAILAVTVIE